MKTPLKPRANYDEQPIVQPPNTSTVPDSPKVVLYHPDGQPLVRKIGFK